MSPFQLSYGEPESQPIIDGQRVLAASYPAVVKILTPDDSLCSGTLIASRFVLTAAHCFFTESHHLIPTINQTISVINNVARRTKHVTVHPTYVSRDKACITGEVDAAVIELDGDIADIAPIPLSRVVPTAGTRLMLVGFGVEGTAATGESDNVPPDGYVNYGFTNLDRVLNSQYVEWTFDGTESNTSSGDSGGPAFEDAAGAKILNSITCGGTGNAGLGTDSTNTRVDTIASWVDQVTGVITSPNIPSPPPPFPGSETINVTKSKINLYDDGDLLLVQGTIALETGFKPKGLKVQINVADVNDTFTFNKDGYAPRKRGYDFIRLNGKLSKGAFTGNIVRLSLSLGDRSALYDKLEDLFPPEDESAGSDVRISLPVTITFGSHVFMSAIPMKYSGKSGRWING